MQHESNAGQRRFQLVADCGHQIALHLIQQAEARHVAEDDGGAKCNTEGIFNRQNLREIRTILAAVAKGDGLIERLGQERAVLLKGVLKRLAKSGGRYPGGGRRLSRRRMAAWNLLRQRFLRHHH